MKWSGVPQVLFPYQINFTIKLWSAMTFSGFRAVHSEHIRPVDGGSRFSPYINMDVINRS